LQRTLRGLMTESLGKLDAFKTKVEAWYDTSQERITGIYKRFTQYFALAFGMGLAIFLNVDAIQVATHLWTHEDARTAVVNAAEAFVQEAADTAEEEATAAADATLRPLQEAVTEARADLDVKTRAAAAPGAGTAEADAVIAAQQALDTALQALE